MGEVNSIKLEIENESRKKEGIKENKKRHDLDLDNSLKCKNYEGKCQRHPDLNRHRLSATWSGSGKKQDVYVMKLDS